jgi:cyclopropane-fatty-acyl-phospholipid synthase
MWERLFLLLARRMIRQGQLGLVLPSGKRVTLNPGRGDPDGAGGLVMRIHDPALVRRLCLNPELAFGEGYMDGGLTIDGNDLPGVIACLKANVPHHADLPLWQRPAGLLRQRARALRQWNPAPRAHRNVAHHYDLSGALYDLFLDKDRQYSCAYFRTPDMTLDDAQAAKKQHIAAKLMLRPGDRVLDIGCGWGGMALTLARDLGARVLGITLSAEQLKIARARAAAAGLSDRIEFRLQDYRDVPERFDRVVSVGMFEHVGVPHYGTFFAKVRDLLTEDGVALIHTIGRTAPPSYTSPWLGKYIFPGGYCPALSEVIAPVERSGLVQTDIEVWRLHYAMTLRHWHDRFVARQDAARALYDERFFRMWRFYLIAAEMAFVHGQHVVFQLQLARRQDTVPLTRDYLYPAADQPHRRAHSAE